MDTRTKLNLPMIITATTSVLFWSPIQAQLTFSVADLPKSIGIYYRAYLSTNVEVSSLLGERGGPFRWDFTQPLGMDEVVLRADWVAPTDLENGTNFLEATYSERLTKESNGAQSWSFYSVAAGTGRTFYGSYDAVTNPEHPLRIFGPPTVDLPDPVRFGQTWTRSTAFEDALDLGFAVIPVSVHFTAQAEVDAYGILILPNIGEIPALRVNEVHTWEFEELLLNLPLMTNYTRNCYWLVGGIGKAVDILSLPSQAIPPDKFATASIVLRGFEVRPWPVTNLRIRLQSQQAIFDWRQETNSSGYRIETRREFSANVPWHLLAEPTNNSWADPLLASKPQMFFRVFIRP